MNENEIASVRKIAITRLARRLRSRGIALPDYEQLWTLAMPSIHRALGRKAEHLVIDVPGLRSVWDHVSPEKQRRYIRDGIKKNIQARIR